MSLLLRVPVIEVYTVIAGSTCIPFDSKKQCCKKRFLRTHKLSTRGSKSANVTAAKFNEAHLASVANATA